jgi:hypothetical protein
MPPSSPFQQLQADDLSSATPLEDVKRAKVGNVLPKNSRHARPEPGKNAKARSTAHSRSKEHLSKEATLGAIRGAGKFVVIAVSEVGNVSCYCTHEGQMGHEGQVGSGWQGAELQSWLRTRFLARHRQFLDIVGAVRTADPQSADDSSSAAGATIPHWLQHRRAVAVAAAADEAADEACPSDPPKGLKCELDTG